MKSYHDSWWYEIGKRKKERRREAESETHGYSSVKSTSHGNIERAGQAESRRRGETSGCFEKVHTLLALCTHQPPPLGPALLFACSPTPLYWQWRLRWCIVSLTRGVLLDYNRKIPKSKSTRRISVSLIEKSIVLVSWLIYFIYGFFLLSPGFSVSRDAVNSFCGYHS